MPGSRGPGGKFRPDTEPEAPTRETILERKYEVAEHKALDVIQAYLNSDGDDTSLHKRVKVAQATLGHVQSHNRNALGRRVLDFEMVRTVTNDPDRLAEYIRATAPTQGVIAAIEPRKIV